MTLHTKKSTTGAMDACDASATEKPSTGAAAASHVDECTASEVVMGCQKMDDYRQTVTRAELISALEAVRDANDRLNRLRRRIFWDLA